MIDRLPPLLVGARRGQFAGLVATGVGQAALAGLTAVVMPMLLTATSTAERLLTAGALAAGALGLGLMRMLERIVAERLSQDYVQQVRRGLVSSSLAGRGPSVGITVARTTNDLNSVRNWIALGITPLAVGIPVIVGSLGALALLDPVLAWAAAVPMLALAILLAVLSREAFARSRVLRRRRGRLAAHVSDTVTAADSIRAAGGMRRELGRIDKIGGRVVAAAVARARVSGHIRGSAAAAASLAMVSVAAAGSWQGVSGAHIATALTIVGVLAGPASDLGRVVEYRQSYRAAALIVGPALAAGRMAEHHELRLRDRLAAIAPGEDARGPAVQSGALRVTGLVVDGAPVPDFAADPGERVALRGDPRRVHAVVRAIAGLDTGPDDQQAAPPAGRVTVAGHALDELPGDLRRLLVGLAMRGQALERGTIARAVRYRNPASVAAVWPVLEAVGLGDTVRALPEAERTRLRRGGEPLSLPERARLLLARALYTDPPLVVLDHVDAQLGDDGREALRRCVAAQPGVVVVASDRPDAILGDHRVWDLDGQGPPRAGGSADARDVADA